MARLMTLVGERDERELQKRTGKLDNDVERTVVEEYCLLDCDGPAHKTGIPDDASYFCAKHVRRGVTIQLKQGLELFGTAAKLG